MTGGLSGRRILIVEHDEAIADFMAQLLTDEGYEVLSLLSCEREPDTADIARHTPDLIILDLPSMNASPFAFLDCLLDDPSTKLTRVLCTSTSASLAEQCLSRANVRCAISKPFSIEDLLEMVARSLPSTILR